MTTLPAPTMQNVVKLSPSPKLQIGHGCSRRYSVAQDVCACHTRSSQALVLSFRTMTPHVISSGVDEHTVSPVLSSTASFFSVRSILSGTPLRSPGVPETFHAPESQTKGVGSFVTELSGGGKATCTYPEANTSFIQHHKYFFQDENITFLDSTMTVVCTFDSVSTLYVGRVHALLHPSILILSRLGILLCPICPVRHP
jgi:hypothetical protein